MLAGVRIQPWEFAPRAGVSMERIFVVLLAAFFFLSPVAYAEELREENGPLQFFSAFDAGIPPYAEAAAKNSVSPASNKSLVLLNLENNSLTLKTQYLEKSDDKLRFLDLPAHPREQFGLLATSSVIDKYLAAEGEIAYSSAAANSPRSQSLLDFGETQNRLLRLGVKGTAAEFSYGAEYRSVGKDFFNLANAKVAKDQDGGEIWLQRKLGIFGLKLSGSDFTNNVARDPSLPQIHKLQGGASASIAPPSWPVLSVFYYKGVQRSSNEPGGFDPQSGPLDTVGASLSYKGSRWDGTLAATYALSDITSRLGREQNAVGRYTVNTARVRTMTPGLSFGWNYYLSPPVQLSAFGSYSKTTASDKYTNSDVLNLGAALNWKFGLGAGAAKNTLSVGGAFNAHRDNVNAYNSNHDVSVWTRLKIPVF